MKVSFIFIRIRTQLHIAVNKLGFGTINRALRLRSCLWEKLNCQLLLLADPSIHDLHSPHFNETIDLATTKLMSPEYFDVDLRRSLHKEANHIVPKDSEISRVNLGYENNKQAVDKIAEAHQGSETVRSTLANGLRVQSYLNGHFRNYGAANIFIEMAKQYDSKISEIDSSSISSELRSTRRELRTLKQAVSSKKAIKLSLTNEYITAILSISSALFLVSGFFYTRSLLGHFGIEVSDYFSLSDYVAASIEGIRYSLFATIFAIIAGFIGIHNRSRLSYQQSRTVANADDRIYLLIVLVTLSATCYAYFGRPEGFYSLMVLSTMLVSPRLIIWTVRRHFAENNWLTCYFVIQSVLLFSLHLYGSVMTEIYRIESTPSSELKRYDIIFDDSVGLALRDTVLVASNSRYLFLHDGPNGKTYILPTSQVRSISVR